MKVDLFQLVRTDGKAAGVLPFAHATRIDTPERSGELAWKAAARADTRVGHGAVGRLDLDIDGAVVLVCQRCLQPMTEPLALRAHFVVAGDEESADVLDADDAFDVIVGAPDFDLDALVEDEVLLALPIAPRHAVCPTDDALAVESGAKPSPFAVLQQLKLPRRDADEA